MFLSLSEATELDQSIIYTSEEEEEQKEEEGEEEKEEREEEKAGMCSVGDQGPH